MSLRHVFDHKTGTPNLAELTFLAGVLHGRGLIDTQWVGPNGTVKIGSAHNFWLYYEPSGHLVLCTRYGTDTERAKALIEAIEQTLRKGPQGTVVQGSPEDHVRWWLVRWFDAKGLRAAFGPRDRTAAARNRIALLREKKLDSL